MVSLTEFAERQNVPLQNMQNAQQRTLLPNQTQDKMKSFLNRFFHIMLWKNLCLHWLSFVLPFLFHPFLAFGDALSTPK